MRAKARSLNKEKKTYKSQPIRLGVRLHKLVDVTFHHPFRYHYEAILGHGHAQQPEDVWMAEGPPCHDLPAEPLRGTVNRWYTTNQGQTHQLTLLVGPRSFLEYTLRALAATSWPQCSPFHTSADPP